LSIATEPGEAALHNPGEACNLERALTAFDDLQLPAGLPQQVARELATLVSGISIAATRLMLNRLAPI
jgi:hypothetical protein